MHIKTITIQGFKSYKNHTVTDEFSPHHNVVVGRNGSGKSNFFAAIRFVLSDAYTKLSREERQSLLHEGSGTAVMSAFVEICFDNSDRRLPISSDEVVIRRTIGLKKDEYSIDHKSATKNEVMDLLESGGFSRANPYYIVPQGRITSLTNAKDEQRLNLLKEVAGTQVYDQKRQESLKVLEETEGQRKRINDSLTLIRERLAELETEKEELRDYHEKDREKRSLEYIILDRELKDITATIERLEEARFRSNDQNVQSLEEFTAYDERIAELEEFIFNLKNQNQLLLSEKDQLTSDLSDKIKTKAQRELEYSQITESGEQYKKQSSSLQSEIKSLRKTISGKTAQLNQISPQLESLLQQENDLRQQVQRLESNQTFLHSKQGRNHRFTSKKERDNWLNNEIQGIGQSITTSHEIQSTLQADLDELEQKLNETHEIIQQSRDTVMRSTESTQQSVKLIDDTVAQCEKLKDERKVLWRDIRAQEAEVEKLQKACNTAQSNAFSTLSHAQKEGLNAVNRIVKKLNLTGVYGPLAELISVTPQFEVAAEVTAGNSLFHIVVDNEDTATTIMQELYRENSGRATFMPLNRLHPKRINYPEHEHVLPLISNITYAEEIDSAVRQVFGKTVVTMNLDLGLQISQGNDLNAITMSGDRVSNKGTITGGFYDTRKSRLAAFIEYQRIREELEKQVQHLNDLKDQNETKSQEINKINNDINSYRASHQKLMSSLSPLDSLLHSKVVEEGQIKELISEKKKTLQSTASSIEALTNNQASLTTELNSPFNQVLSSEEIQTLKNLSSILPPQQKKLQEISFERTQVEQSKTELEIEITQNLQSRLDRLVSKLSSLLNKGDDSAAAASASISESKRILEQLKKEIKATKTELTKLAEKTDENIKEITANEGELQQLKDSRIKLARSIENLNKQAEKHISKRSVLVQRRDEVVSKIRELGVLPPDAFTRYESVDADTLLKKFHRVSNDLKRYGHVNKKAVEQYNEFTKNEEGLEHRKAELEQSRKSIERLIKTLDMRKDEAIDRTFRQVSKCFSEIFEKLVPAGKGELVMHRKRDATKGRGRGRGRGRHSDDAANEEEEEEEEDEEDEDGDVDMDNTAVTDGSRIFSIESYVGIGISVSFNSKEDDQQRIEQLSGGQKSLCALTLIFAIQMSDPAPFYLFDEIDANLDTQYRTAVAAMIREQARSAQFICTTFRTEMIHVADQFYGVSFQNKMSSIASITQDDALTFVEGQQRP
ncbi:uncharacterized protein SAPINGB_P001575 [Magnusiomyces paraingens]|uniref:Structural maintenance of chromosomes protein n=1 Tax=Magnusiomyces paraingens TaxID=2606893 RepID=A0A5E8B8L7_9ASCO|nr:uncharacterized protein SAPINGB_P001575 [Saprochaete ingens]VVT47165.1 unnamed protein product [Saprochaete ingens]